MRVIIFYDRPHFLCDSLKYRCLIQYNSVTLQNDNNVLVMRFSVLFLVVIYLLPVSCKSNGNTTPEWLENDSETAIYQRTLSDFSLTMSQAKEQLLKLYPNISETDINEYISNKYLEVKEFEGEKRMHRKSPSNLKLLCPEIRGEWNGRGSDATAEEILWVDSIVRDSEGNGSISNEKIVKYRFAIDVPKHDFLIGDTLRVWMPLPIESERQRNIKILSSIPQEYEVSTDKSVHNTIYFEAPVLETSDSIIHFEYIGEYNVAAQYYSPEYIEQKLKPYDESSELYSKYTSEELPHIIRFDSLARSIVGDEKSPFKQSELVYDYIIKNYPWAGAREYSTIECIPQYVLNENHGDCGQVALLYISLMRTLGVPARWESGWMLHPGQKNLHDWAEVYFNGIGWVAVDISFGRFTDAKDKSTQNYYSTGMDQYRFATNKGVCGELYPPKKYIRSETIDFQVGEVECSKGNLFYPGWKKRLEILETKYIDK